MLGKIQDKDWRNLRVPDASTQLLCRSEILTCPVKAFIHSPDLLMVVPFFAFPQPLTIIAFVPSFQVHRFPSPHRRQLPKETWRLLILSPLGCSGLSTHCRSGPDCNEVQVKFGRAENTGECVLGWEGALDQSEQRISFKSKWFSCRTENPNSEVMLFEMLVSKICSTSHKFAGKWTSYLDGYFDNLALSLVVPLLPCALGRDRKRLILF